MGLDRCWRRLISAGSTNGYKQKGNAFKGDGPSHSMTPKTCMEA